MLQLDNVRAGYGRVEVLHGIDLVLESGSILGLLGRNGAGKTTTIRAIMGLVDGLRGSIRLGSTELAGVEPHHIPGHGIAWVPQGRRLFPEMTVGENLRLGLLAGRDRGVGRDGHGGGATGYGGGGGRGGDAGCGRDAAQGEGTGRGEDAAGRLAFALDLFPALKERLGTPARRLSGGQQQMVAMARALAAGPRVLLLDEPTEGLQPSYVDRILETISDLRATGTAMLLVEQKVEAALAVVDRIAFIENGRIREHATPASLARDPDPLTRYVGVRRGG